MNRDQHVWMLWERMAKIADPYVWGNAGWNDLWERWNAVIDRKFGQPTRYQKCRRCGNDGTKPSCGYLFCVGTI